MWIDATVPMENGMPVWPGDEPFCMAIEQTAQVAGAVSTQSRFGQGTHCGTHIDAPFHYDPAGARVDAFDAQVLVGPAYVLDLTGQLTGHIRVQDVQGRFPEGCKRLLIKTDNSKWLGSGGFRNDFIALEPEAAAYLARQGIQLLGIDAFSIGPMGRTGDQTHRAFLKGRLAVALETVPLREVRSGAIQLICAPLKLAGAEAAPARVWIWQEEG